MYLAVFLPVYTCNQLFLPSVFKFLWSMLWLKGQGFLIFALRVTPLYPSKIIEIKGTPLLTTVIEAIYDHFNHL